MPHRSMIALTFLLFLPGTPAQAEDMSAKPSYIMCMKAVSTPDFFSRQIPEPACTTVVEKKCFAAIRDEASCLDEFIEATLSFVELAAAVLPPQPPEELTGFVRNTYERRLKNVKSEAKEVDLPICEADPKVCVFIGEAVRLTDVLQLARLTNTVLP